MAMLTPTIFDSPYVTLGTDIDICEDCLREFMRQHPEKDIYTVKKELKGKITGEKVFKLFRNSNTPYILCKEHFKKIYDEMFKEENNNAI